MQKRTLVLGYMGWGIRDNGMKMACHGMVWWGDQEFSLFAPETRFWHGPLGESRCLELPFWALDSFSPQILLRASQTSPRLPGSYAPYLGMRTWPSKQAGQIQNGEWQYLAHRTKHRALSFLCLITREAGPGVRSIHISLSDTCSLLVWWLKSSIYITYLKALGITSEDQDVRVGVGLAGSCLKCSGVTELTSISISIYMMVSHI